MTHPKGLRPRTKAEVMEEMAGAIQELVNASDALTHLGPGGDLDDAVARLDQAKAAATTAIASFKAWKEEGGSDSAADGGRSGAEGAPSPWYSMDETPRPGTKIVALWNDGSGAELLFIHDGGAIRSEGDDCTFSPKSYERWAYLPAGFEFWCEGLPEDAVTLPDQPDDLFAPPPQPRPPEGWRVVPVEPTLAMAQAGGAAIDKQDGCGYADEHFFCAHCDDPNWAGCRANARVAYRAMLSAAPPPPAPEVAPLTLPDDVRERAARVIDAGAFVEDETAVWLRSERQQALSKADQIIAIITGGE